MSAPPLFICRSGAWTPEAAACLEVSMTAGVFEQQPVLVLMEAAVTLLLPNQAGDKTLLKTLSRQIPALELYGVNTIWVDAMSLHRYGIDNSVLPAGARTILMGELATLINSASTVMVY